VDVPFPLSTVFVWFIGTFFPLSTLFGYLMRHLSTHPQSKSPPFKPSMDCSFVVVPAYFLCDKRLNFFFFFFLPVLVYLLLLFFFFFDVWRNFPLELLVSFFILEGLILIRFGCLAVCFLGEVCQLALRFISFR